MLQVAKVLNTLSTFFCKGTPFGPLVCILFCFALRDFLEKILFVTYSLDRQAHATYIFHV